MYKYDKNTQKYVDSFLLDKREKTCYNNKAVGRAEEKLGRLEKVQKSLKKVLDKTSDK